MLEEILKVFGYSPWNSYFCEQIQVYSLLKYKSMAIGFNLSPVVAGESARRFLEEKARVDSLPLKELPEKYIDELKAFLAKSRKYWREHEAGDIQSER